jgi:hypothetical protein
MARGFKAAGLENIAEVTLTIRMDFASFDDYWFPLINGQGTLVALFSTLPQGTPGRVQAAVRNAYLSGQPDGPRSFVSAAWVIKEPCQLDRVYCLWVSLLAARCRLLARTGPTGPSPMRLRSQNRVRSSCAKQYKRLKTSRASSKGPPTLGSPLRERITYFFMPDSR